AVADEEALEGRLDHVLRVELAGQQAVEPAAGQGDQPGGEPLEHLARGRVVAGAEPGHQAGERVGVGHDPSGRGRAAAFFRFYGCPPSQARLAASARPATDPSPHASTAVRRAPPPRSLLLKIAQIDLERTRIFWPAGAPTRIDTGGAGDASPRWTVHGTADE